MAPEQRLIDASPDDCIKKVKRKTNFAKIIVSGTAEKPYYEIMWFNYMDGEYHFGYGSYNLNFVFQWLAECFEVEDAPTVDAVEVPDKELLRAIKLLIKQYEHSKNSEYVHSPVAHALYHTWRQVDERRTDHV